MTGARAGRRRTLFTWVGAWLPALVWMGAIFYLSAQSAPPRMPARWLDNLVETGGHFTGYAVLAYLYWRIARLGPWSKRVALGVAFGCTLLYALSDELHQRFVPGRSPSLGDVLTDAAGAAVALALVAWLRRRRIAPSRP